MLFGIKLPLVALLNLLKSIKIDESIVLRIEGKQLRTWLGNKNYIYNPVHLYFV